MDPCTVYENRNAELVVPVPQPPQPVQEPPAKAASPAPAEKPVPRVVTSPPVILLLQPFPLKQKPASKPAVAKPAAVLPPAKSAAKASREENEGHSQDKSQELGQTDSQSHQGTTSEIRQEDCDKAEEEVTIRWRSNLAVSGSDNSTSFRPSGARARSPVRRTRLRPAGFPLPRE